MKQIKRMGVGIALALTLVACTTAVQDSDAEIFGTWLMVSFSQDGVPAPIKPDLNTAGEPYIDFDVRLSGVGGCNSFESSEETYLYEDGLLDPGEVVFTAALCVPEELNLAERALMAMLWAETPIEVEVEGDSMAWTLDGETIAWVAIDEPPPPPTIPPQTSIGPLDCGSQELVSEDATIEGADFEAAGEHLVSSQPGVETHEKFDPSSLNWTGYDSSGEPIVVVAFQDIFPEFFKVYTCP